MNFLPVVERELITLARRGAGQWGRFVAVLTGTVLFILLWQTPLQAQPQALSQLTFGVFSWGLCLFAFPGGALFTVDAIAAERRSGTLGLLFLTELGGFDIAVGKWVSHSMQAVYGLLAMAPVLALPVMVGGVSMGRMVRTFLAVLVALVLSLTAGLLASTFRAEFRRNLTMALLGLSLLVLVTDGGGFLHERLLRRTATPVRALSPFAAFRWAKADPQRNPVGHTAYRTSLRSLALLSAVLMVGTALRARRYRDEVIEAEAVRAPGKEGKPHGLVGYRHIHWGETLERHPYEWFELVRRPVSRELVLLQYAVLVASLGMMVASAFLSRGKLGIPVAVGGIVILWLGHVLLKLHFTLAATRGPSEDRADGALELLHVSGITIESMVNGHRRALVRQFRWPVMVLCAVQLAWPFRLAMEDFGALEGAGLSMVLACGVAALFVELDALVLVGLRHGLREPGPQAAFRATLVRVLLPGWIGLLPVVVLLGVGVSGGMLSLVLGIWFVASAYLHQRARRRARIDVEYGFLNIAAGLGFDTDEWELRDSFRRAAGW